MVFKLKENLLFKSIWNCFLFFFLARTDIEKLPISLVLGFLGDSDSKASACNAGDTGSILGLETSPGEGNVNPLQYSCL